jgi:hypothetical protein
MFGTQKIGLFIAASIAVGAMANPVLATESGQQRASGDADTRQVLTLMDRAKTGQVSRQAYMSAMNAEYSRLAGIQDGQPGVKTSAPHR